MGPSIQATLPLPVASRNALLSWKSDLNPPGAPTCSLPVALSLPHPAQRLRVCSTAQGAGICLCHLGRRLSPSGLPGSSVGKESACNAGDPGSIPGLGKSPGEGIGYPLQYSWASLVAQLVKDSAVVQETWV